MKPEGDFTNSLWESIKPVYRNLIRHPFVIQLANGTLPHQCFAHYLAQDILYIKDDSIALEKLSKKAKTAYEQTFFKSLANDGLAIERELHDYFLKYFNVSEAQNKSFVIEKYTHFLNAHAEKSPYYIAAAALLPCFWVYNKVGKHIVKHAVKHNVYQKWIGTYQGEEYEIYTRKFIQIVERLANDLTENKKAQMRQAFVKSTKFELSFFEEAVTK